MVADPKRLDELANAVADRLPVTWTEELRSTDSIDRALVEQLRNVERIVEAHWGLPGSPSQLGDFEIIREIGRGGMGVVYEVRQVSLDRHVAMKVLSAELTSTGPALKRFEREARALATLNHPSIVMIHSVERLDGLHFITMELVEGEVLSTRIPENGMPIMQLLDIAIPLADALSSAHERRIIHRDLKPANIMVNREGRVKILDFGLAKLRREHRIVPDARSLTARFSTSREGALTGTIPYMSPEQAKCRELDHRSDLFSLGVILYEMATGHRPFGGSSPAEVIESILQDYAPPVALVSTEQPADLGRMIAHCLRKDPEHRYQTAKGLRNELEELQTKIELDKHRPRRNVGRSRLYRALAFTAAAVFFVALVPPLGELVQGWLGFGESPAARYISVQPFKVIGDEHQGTHAIGDGLAEVLTTRLTRLSLGRDIQIAACNPWRGSSPPSIEEIGESQGVDLAVVGSLLQVGDRVRVTVNLVDVRDQRQLRADVIDADLRDPIAFQDRIVLTVVKMLDLKLSPREKERLRVLGTTESIAHRLYLQGRGHLRHDDQVEEVDRAIQVFRQTLKRDPDYARAWVGLGVAYWKRFAHDDDPSWVTLASESCSEALRLDDTLAEGHACLGTVYSGSGRYGEAAAEFGWAISLDPTNDEAFHGLGRLYEDSGSIVAAETVYRKAISQRPRYWATHNWLGELFFASGRYLDAEMSFKKVVALAPNRQRGHQNLGAAYLMQGKYSDAISALERSVSIKPTPHGYSKLARCYFGIGQFEKAVAFCEEAIELGRMDYVIWGNLGEAYFWMPDRHTESREAYRRAVELAEQQLGVNPDDSEALGELGKYHAMLGEREQALGNLEKGLKSGPVNADLQFNAAVIHNRLGNTGAALDWLERTLASGTSPTRIRDNPVFDNLRDDEKYRALTRDG